MDSRFLEFWGNFLLSAARGQKQMEDMARWMNQGFKAAGFEDLAAMFTRAYGLAGPDPEKVPDADFWQAAGQQFRSSFEEYMKLMGMVPREEHRRLEKKYEALKKECDAHKETISHLRELLGAGKAGQDEVISAFQAIIEKQSSQFRDLVDSSTRFMKEATATPEAKKTSS